MAAYRIHQDQENRGAEIKLTNKDANQQQKRAVLGILNKNVSKNQPLRKKDNTWQDGKLCVTQKLIPALEKASFTIHADKFDENTVVAEETKQVSIQGKNKETNLPAAITTLLRPPLTEIEYNDADEECKVYTYEEEEEDKENDEGSPMSLDKSAIISPEKEDAEKSARMMMLDVDEYRDEIFLYLRETEARHRPKFGYMQKQPDITYSMRSILVDWLVEVAEEYKLQTETLYLAVSYIDRFLSYMSVVRAKLQLVGTAAMFIASKYEEIYPPDVKEFVYITDDTYTKKQVLRMEHLILKVLAFDLSVPTPLTFITIFSVTAKLSHTTVFLAMYLCELTLLEADPFLQYQPSELAAASVALARHTMDQEVWPDEVEDATGYRFEELKRCISHLYTTYSNASMHPQQAIRVKYKANRWHNVSLLSPRTPPPC